MDLKEFANAVKNAMEEQVDGKVTLNEVTKNNGLKLVGLCITEKESNISPTIYLDYYHKQYEGGVKLAVIVNEIYKMYEDKKISISLDISIFTDFEKVQKRIVYKLINRVDNKELLEDIPHEYFLDLAKVYYVLLDTNDIANGSILIHNSHLTMWGIDTNRINDLAMENTEALLPASIIAMEEILREMIVEIGDDSLEAISDNNMGMYVVTNQMRLNGDAVLLYSDLVKDFAEQLGQDIYMIPSSVHEWIFIPATAGINPKEIRGMVKEVNETQVEVTERLSNNVYYYSRKTNFIIIS